MEKNELKKEFFKNKTTAEFSHYCSGNLYYKVAALDGVYQFPIETVGNKGTILSPVDGSELQVCQLSKDLGSTSFNAKERASMFWRWIDKAIDGDEFVKVG